MPLKMASTLVKKIAEPRGLAVSGEGGYHTPIGEHGIVDISPRKMLFVTEGELMMQLFDGVKVRLSFMSGGPSRQSLKCQHFLKYISPATLAGPARERGDPSNQCSDEG